MFLGQVAAYYKLKRKDPLKHVPVQLELLLLSR